MSCGKSSKAYSVGLFSALDDLLFGYHSGVISGVLIILEAKWTLRTYIIVARAKERQSSTV
jgi:hypothetical protein